MLNFLPFYLTCLKISPFSKAHHQYFYSILILQLNHDLERVHLIESLYSYRWWLQLYLVVVLEDFEWMECLHYEYYSSILLRYQAAIKSLSYPESNYMSYCLEVQLSSPSFFETYNWSYSVEVFLCSLLVYYFHSLVGLIEDLYALSHDLVDRHVFAF